MSDFLTRLAERTLGLTQPVQPLNTPRYAPDVVHPGDLPMEREELERQTGDARPPLPSRHPPLEAAKPVRDTVQRRGKTLGPKENKRATVVAEEKNTVSPGPAFDISSNPRTVDAPRLDVDAQESPSSPTTGRQVSHVPDSVRPGLPLSVPGQDDASLRPRTEAEHEALSRSEARPVTTPSGAGGEDAPVPSRREPYGLPADAHNAEQTRRIANVPNGDRRGARLSGRSVEDGSHDGSVPEHPAESPFAGLTERSKPGDDDAPSSTTREDAAELSPSETTVRVTIGRIDVRAISPPAPAQRRVERPAPGPSLDAYLQSHNGHAP
jgi:hypothetical protein